MHVVLATVGTLGDIRPFVALGVGLTRLGHRVTLATHRDYEALAGANGLAFRAIGASFKQLVESEPGRAWIESSDSLFRYLRLSRQLLVEPARQWLDDAFEAVGDADVVVGHPLATGAWNGAEARRVPALFASLYPLVPSGELAPMFSPNAPQWPWLRRTMTTFALRQVSGLYLDLFAAQRRRAGLTPWRTRIPFVELVAEGAPCLNLWSEHVVAAPGDWPAHVPVTGYCFLDEPSFVPPAELRAFVESDDTQPIYVGFGSMTGRDPEELTKLVLDAVGRTKERAVIVSGWGGIQPGRYHDRVYIASEVPHDWLFARVRAVVHHGGAGTFAAGLRAGKPTLVVPFFGDQGWWGSHAVRLGVGPQPLLRRKLSAAALATAIGRVVAEPRHRAMAEELGRAIREEDGVGRAIARIEDHVARWSPSSG